MGSGSVLNNAGTIETLFQSVFQSAGNYTSISIQNSGIISSSADSAVYLTGGTIQLVNSGTIEGYTYAVSITSYDPIVMSLLNSGQMTGGMFIGIYKQLDVTVVNSGKISGSYAGITQQEMAPLDNQPSTIKITNSSTGVISATGPNAVFLSVFVPGSTTYLSNDGLISASGSAAESAYRGATVILQGTSTLVNTGTIEATGLTDGVAILGRGTIGQSIFNSGMIRGAVTAVQLSDGNDKLQNSGTIQGGVSLGAGNDTLDGTGGHIQGTIAGGDGNDLFILSDSLAVVNEAVGGGTDTVQSSVDYTLAAGQEIETLILTGTARLGTGNEFANTLTGNDQDNKLSGLAGLDTMNGGLGNDTLNGGTENDSLSGGDDNDRLIGDTGNDVLNGDNGDDVLFGQLNNDKLYGGVGDDTLNGGSGTDSLSGGDGDDVLIGGQNRDTLTGGADADTFVFAKVSEIGTVAAATNDIITDLVRGTDKIDISQIDAITSTSGNDAFTFINASAFSHVAGQLHYVVSGANILLEGDVNGDGVADFQLQINAITSITAGDIVL
jgi:Ca2+-binding RTX toxin-like protein